MSAPAAVTRTRSATDLFEVRVVQFEVPLHVADQVEEAAEWVAEHTRCHESGTRLFAMLRDADNPGRFLCAAVFDDEEAERKHHNSAPARRLATVLLAVGVRLESPRWTGVAGI
jgi:quinol monooxygenase YgiN